jgi:bifunctional non-homologous end joining protein LigD
MRPPPVTGYGWASIGRRSATAAVGAEAGYHRVAMTDQLSLRLEPDLPTLPNLPTTLRPMLARPIPEAFDSPDHLFEPSWGGVRALVFVGPADAPGAGDVRIVDGSGADVSAALPELAGLAVRVDARSAVLDGELVLVDGEGRADAAGLAVRLSGGVGRPVAFLAFDLLHLDGRSLLGIGLERRRALLRRVLRPGDEVVAVPAILGEGRALFDAAAAQGIAGVMARQRASPYLPGVRSRLWRFIEARRGRRQRRVAGGEAGAVPEAGGPTIGGSSTGPVLALISRLPLLEDDDEG